MLVYSEVVEVVVFGFEVMIDHLGVSVGFVVGDDSDMRL